MLTGGYIVYNNKINISSSANTDDGVEIDLTNELFDKFVESNKPILVTVVLNSSNNVIGETNVIFNRGIRLDQKSVLIGAAFTMLFNLPVIFIAEIFKSDENESGKAMIRLKTGYLTEVPLD